MNDRKRRPAKFAVFQPIINPFAREWTWRVCVPAPRFVHDQQMLIFKENARRHEEIEPRRNEIWNSGTQEQKKLKPPDFFLSSKFNLPKLPRTFPYYPNAEQEICDRVSSHCVAKPVFADDQPLIGKAAK